MRDSHSFAAFTIILPKRSPSARADFDVGTPMLLDLIPIVLLGIVTVWFFWPNLTDFFQPRVEKPDLRQDADHLADRFFRDMTKYGRGASQLSQTERSQG